MNAMVQRKWTECLVLNNMQYHIRMYYYAIFLKIIKLTWSMPLSDSALLFAWLGCFRLWRALPHYYLESTPCTQVRVCGRYCHDTSMLSSSSNPSLDQEVTFCDPQQRHAEQFIKGNIYITNYRMAFRAVTTEVTHTRMHTHTHTHCMCH